MDNWYARRVNRLAGETVPGADLPGVLGVNAAKLVPLEAARAECRWQRAQLPSEIRELVLDDQRLRNDICWSVFE